MIITRFNRRNHLHVWILHIALRQVCPTAFRVTSSPLILSVPSVKSTPSHIAMSSDLAERFEVMQIKKAQLRQSQDVMKMSFEELGR